MRNIFFIVVCIFFSPLQGYSQQDKSQGIVTYEFHSYGGYTYNTYLYFKDGQYWYTRHEEPRTYDSDEGYRFYHYKHHYDWYAGDKQDSVLMVHEDASSAIYTKWKAKEIDWKITSETKKIGGFTAQKAVCQSYKEDSESWQYGNLIVWFTTDLPISLSPEGYDGLPGLVLEYEYQSEDMNIFYLTFSGISYEPVPDWNLPVLEDKVSVSKRQIYNLGLIDKKWLKKQQKALKSEK
ncbi:MAG: GLPGLI family protein [Bacteroidota bacterium]